MTNIHKAIDCVVFNKNLVNVKMNLEHVKDFTLNITKPVTTPTIPQVPDNNLLSMRLKNTDEIIITDNNQTVLISFENQRTNQHKMSNII